MAFKPLRTFTNRVGVTFDENRTQVVYAEDLNDIKESLEFLYENIGAIEDWIARVPTGFSLTVVSQTAIDLDWTNVDTTGDGVKVERSTDGVTFTEIASLVLGVDTYSDTGLTQGTEYFYRIKSYKGASSSNYTTIISEFTTSSMYGAVYSAMTNKPTGNDIIYQNRWISKIASIAGTKIAVLYNLACQDVQSSLLNWYNPSAFNGVFLGTPTHTAHKGFLFSSSPSALIRTYYIPSTNGAGKLTKDNLTLFAGFSNETNFSSRVLGGNTWSTNALGIYSMYNGFAYARVNQSSSATTYSLKSKRYFAISRKVSTEIEVLKDRCMQAYSANSTTLHDSEIWLGGSASGGASNISSSFMIISEYLTPTEIRGIIEACDDYLSHYSYKIREYNTDIRFNTLIDGTSLTIPSALEDGIFGNINTETYYNGSVGGSVVANLVTRQATLDSKLVTETATYKNLTFIYVGGNEVDNTVGSGTTCYNALKSYIQNRKTAGHTNIFLGTMLPKNDATHGTQFEIERDTFNGLLKSDLALLSGVYIVDVDTIAESANPLNTTYYTDGIHPTYTLNILIGNLFKSIVDSIF